jgi:peroxiredoxin Q/BCP
MKRMTVLFLMLSVATFLALAADTPTAGTSAPGFNLPNQEGTQISLEQFKGKWVVLYFYPKDFTGGCTREAHNFQRDLDKYTQKNAAILGVSLDTVESHKSFCAKEHLNFKLLADPNHVVIDKYGVPVQEYQGVKYAARVSFLIDPTGVVRKVYPKVDPEKHSEEVLADLEQLQTGK